MGKKLPCESCELRGYSSQLCKVHLNNTKKTDVCFNHNPMKEIGKTAVIGAGVGAAAMFFGIAAIPAAAIKAIFGHVAVVKVGAGAGGGVAGAGYNIFKKVKKNPSAKKTRNKHSRLPFIL